MIINSLFPTASTNGTQDVGLTSGQFQCERTATCDSVDVDMSTFASAYYLGWANPNNLPKAFWLSHCYETETEYVFECIEPSENFMIGFCTMSENITHAGYRQYTGQSAETAVLNNIRLINDLYPEFVGATATNYNIVLHFIGFFSEPGALHVNNYNTTISTANTASDSEKINNYNQWLRYKNGEFKFKFNAPGQYGTYEIGYSDISSTGRIVTTTSTGVNVTLYYKGFSLNGNRRYNGTATSGWNIMPFIVQQGSFEDTDITGGKEFRAVRGSYYNNWAAYYQPLTGNLPGVLHPTTYDAFGAGYDNCVIKKEDIPMGGMNIGDFVDYTTMLLIRTSTYNYQFFPVGDINDIDAFFGLLPRLIRIPSSSDVSSYQEGLTYAPDVSANDEFLCQVKSGNISDESFKAGLRKWQYVDWEEYEEDPTKPQGIQENEFEEEDAPEYDPTPPGPEPGPDDPNEQPIDDNPEAGPDKNDRGKRFPGGPVGEHDYPENPSPFVKYGLFEYNELIVLSGQLWNKPNSFFEGLSAGQEVNPMDYFISLRWYPFPFSLHETRPRNELFLGHGGRLFVSYEEFTNNISIIDFGSIRVKPFYNNFLDYLPYTKVYLFLPYCGQMELNPTVVMDKTITLKAAIDISDGSIVYQLWNDTDGQPLLIKQARVGAEIPITSINAAQMGSNIVNASLSTINQVSKTVGDIGAGAVKGMNAGAVAGPEGAVVGAIAGGALGAISNTTNLISSFSNLGMASKEIVQLSGGSTGIASSGVQIIPYLIYQRPLATNPSTYGHTTGWLCNKAATIGSMNGYTVCKNVDTSNIAQATEKEKAQIKKILDSGFYVN